jgi:hypothetical protein
MFSTLNDGKIVKGLHGVPNEGPVLLVGNHMLMGLEIYSLVPEFLREKNIMVRVVVHPVVFRERQGVSSPEFSLADWMKVMGAVPVTASNLFNLLSTKSHVLLYPGGAREALHNRVSQFPCVKFQQIYLFFWQAENHIFQAKFSYHQSICFISLLEIRCKQEDIV